MLNENLAVKGKWLLNSPPSGRRSTRKGEVVGETCRVSDSYFYILNKSNHSFSTTPA